MILIFSGAVVDTRGAWGLAVVPDLKRRWHRVALLDHGSQPLPGSIYETADLNKAYRLVSSVADRLVEGLSTGADWIDFRHWPDAVTAGTVEVARTVGEGKTWFCMGCSSGPCICTRPAGVPAKECIVYSPAAQEQAFAKGERCTWIEMPDGGGVA